MAPDFQKKMRIQYSLKERDIRVACLIVQSLQNTADLIDEQSPAVLDAIASHLVDLQKPDSGAPPWRQRIRDGIYEYVLRSKQEAEKRERRLYHGITGTTEDPDYGNKG